LRDRRRPDRRRSATIDSDPAMPDDPPDPEMMTPLDDDPEEDGMAIGACAARSAMAGVRPPVVGRPRALLRPPSGPGCVRR
jgi:hypothetical protein